MINIGAPIDIFKIKTLKVFIFSLKRFSLIETFKNIPEVLKIIQQNSFFLSVLKLH